MTDRDLTPAERARLRPAGAYVHGFDGPTVTLSARFVSWLVGAADLKRLRAQVRGNDREIDEQLAALSYCDAYWRTTSGDASDGGSELVELPEAPPSSESMSSTRAAALLAVTPRAITSACKSGRLTATQNDEGRWRITPDNLEHFRRNRAA